MEKVIVNATDISYVWPLSKNCVLHRQSVFQRQDGGEDIGT
jgi:hypothetical protein